MSTSTEGRRLGGRLLLAGLSLLLTLLVIEGALARYYLSTESEWSEQVEPLYPYSLHTSTGGRIGWRRGYLKLAFDPLLGYRNLPDQKTPYFTINSRGYRGPEIASPSGARKRIVVLGGSTAFGTGLRRDKQTFAARLGRLIEGSEVINAAVIGYHSKQELAMLVMEATELRPDLVVLIDGWNDWYFNSDDSGLFRYDVDRMLALSTALTSPSFTTRYAYLPRILFPSIFRFVTGRLQYVLPTSWKKGDPTEMPRRYARNVAKIHGMGKAFGFHFLSVMQIDAKITKNYYRHPNTYDHFRLEASRELDRAGVAWIDLNEFGGRFTADMLMDRIHLSVEGNRTMAEIVAEEIDLRGLLSD